MCRVASMPMHLELGAHHLGVGVVLELEPGRLGRGLPPAAVIAERELVAFALGLGGHRGVTGDGGALGLRARRTRRRARAPR